MLVLTVALQIISNDPTGVMLEIYLISTMLLVMMAKQRPGRKRYTRRRNFVAIPFTFNLALSTLADDTVLKAAIATFGEDLFVISVDASWSLRGLTAGETPIEVGMNHGDLTVVEVEECLDAALTDPDDIIAKEQARRPVRRSGIFQGVSGTDIVLNNGVAIRTPIRFSVGNDHSLDIWAYNRTGAVMTTGAVLQVGGTIFGRWQR